MFVVVFRKQLCSTASSFAYVLLSPLDDESYWAQLLSVYEWSDKR